MRCNPRRCSGKYLFLGTTAISLLMGILAASCDEPNATLASIALACTFLGGQLAATLWWGLREWWAECLARDGGGGRYDRFHRVRKASPILWGMAQVLSLLDCLTSSAYFGRRSEVFTVSAWDRLRRERLVQDRAFWIELYIIGMTILLGLLWVAAGRRRVDPTAACIVAWFAVGQVVLVGVLISIVHFVTAPSTEDSVSSQPRLAVLALVNYLQVLLAFAVICAVRANAPQLDLWESLGRSAEVQMTLSKVCGLPYPEVHAHLAATLLIDLLIVSRFISMLPSYRGYLDR